VGIALRLIAAAAAIALSFSIDGGIFGGLVALFVIVAPFEKLYPRKKGQKVRRPMVATDMAFALMSPVLNIATVAAVIVIGVFSLFWVPGLLVRPLVGALPSAAVPFVAFVLFDFLGYWTHRWAHEVPFLWRFHAVHHSPEHMDWVSGFRVHPFDGVLIAPSAFFLIAAGFDPEVTGVLVILQIVLGIFFHANVRVRWRWLDKLLANPEFHHWHHANEADSICHNYAAALPQWDLLFGTYFMPERTSDRRPQHYGLDEYTPRTMLGLLTHPLRGARKHVSLLWHPVRAVKTIFRGAKNLLRAVRRSTFRKTHSVRVATLPGCSSTNRSLFPADQPGVRPSLTDIPAGVVIEF
jgi:sterol desaturase/sphingolipid hydroxylase (fatty acid hydroxylase superfamily)